MAAHPDDTSVLFLNPGAMGARLAGECQAGRRLWVEQGRSAATADRAGAEGLEAVDDLATAVGNVDLVVSICPPAAAVDVAIAVAACDYNGVYLDANAIAPATMAQVAETFFSSDATIVDGGVIGPPPGKPGSTRLYLSSSARDVTQWVATLWAGSMLATPVMDGDPQRPFRASALKMTYAAWTKGSAAMLMAVNAAAEQLGVAGDLVNEWNISQSGLADRAEFTAAAVGPKAWRFSGEMAEIAAAIGGVGVPADFWAAAGEVYDRLAALKSTTSPSLSDVVDLVSQQAAG